MLGLLMAGSPSPSDPETPGVLYYDPDPTSAKLACAGLRLGGYEVFHARDAEEAVELCTVHGPGGDGRIQALLLDASVDPSTSARVLKALVQVPRAAELPGILVVSRANPTPIPGAQDLPTLKRPFSTPALVAAVRQSLGGSRMGLPRHDPRQALLAPLVQTLRTLLVQEFPALAPDEAALGRMAEHLIEATHASLTPLGSVLLGDVRAVKLEDVLEMLGQEGSSGVLQVDQGGVQARLHLDHGRIRLGEIHGGDEDLKLGRFVVERGFMRDQELEAFLVGKDPEGRPLGARLVQGGFLTTEELAEVLVAQAREVTCHLLTWREGTFRYLATRTLHPLAELAGSQVKTELLVAEALLDGLRRLDEHAAMGPSFAQAEDVFLRVDEEIAALGRHAFSREELNVLELLNGRNSVKDVARKTRAGVFAVAQVLYRLSKANLVRRRVMPVAI